MDRAYIYSSASIRAIKKKKHYVLKLKKNLEKNYSVFTEIK